MDVEISVEAKNKRLNRYVAITVVALSVFLGLTKIKDDNLVQAMQQAKADAVDTWSEYQATKTKLHITQNHAEQIALLAGLIEANKSSGAAGQAAEAQKEIARYGAEIPALAVKARGFEQRYNALNYHDDQFDMCDALISIAISAGAVSALTESMGLLFVAWGFGGLGAVMGLAGVFGWAIHPDAISRLLS